MYANVLSKIGELQSDMLNCWDISMKIYKIRKITPVFMLCCGYEFNNNPINTVPIIKQAQVFVRSPETISVYWSAFLTDRSSIKSRRTRRFTS